MDTLAFAIKFDLLPEFERHQLAVEAFINGALVVPWTDLPVDILELLESAEKPGEHFIWTCTCGIPECGGVQRGVQVTHHAHTVEWAVSDVPFEQAARFEFNQAAYRGAVAGVWQEYVRYFKAYQAAGTAFESCPSLRNNEILERIGHYC